MKLKNKNILIVSRNGALDSSIVGELSKYDCNLFLVSKEHNLSSHIQTSADPGKIKLFKIDVSSQTFFDFINSNKQNIDVILYLAESFKYNQNKINNLIPARLSEIAKSKSIPFIYFSKLDLKANQDSSYGQSKFLGEINIHKKNPQAIVLRHGVIVGNRDKFLDYFVKFASFSKFIIIPKSASRFVVVDLIDLALAVVKILSDFDKYSGQIFELYSEQTYNYEKVAVKVYKALSKKYKLIKLPISFFAIFGVNSDLRKLIRNDCLPSHHGSDFSKLGIQPNSINLAIDTVTSQYLSYLTKQQKLIN